MHGACTCVHAPSTHRAQVVESAQPIIAIAKGLLEPHLNELFRVIQPAMVGGVVGGSIP